MGIVDYVNNCFNLYLNQEESYDEINKKISFQMSFIVYFGISFLISLITNIQDFWTTNSQIPRIQLVLQSSLSSLIGNMIGMLFVYGLTYGMLQFLGGKSNFKETFKFGLSIGILPSLISFIFLFIGNFIYSDITFNQIMWTGLDITLFSIFGLVFIGMFVWTFIVSMQVFEKLHELPKSKVVISLLTPMILGMLLIAGLILALRLIFA